MQSHETQVRIKKKNDDDTDDPTAPFNELEAFDSIWQALRWKQIRIRVPICFKKSIHSRYMLANLVYLGYAIGILIIDFNPTVNGSSASSSSSSDDVTGSTDSSLSGTTIAPLDQPVDNITLVNHLYIGFAGVHILSAFLYWWAWKGRSWLDIIMIPDYLNHIEAGLYLWSSLWYHREDTLGGYYTLAVHKIEMTAATVELVASFGWILSWYLTYIRALGHGFSLDDPDVIAYLSTTIASIIYFVYNIQINVDPAQYGTNFLYTYADILYFLGSCYYIFAALRDDGWFWFLPFCGQYGVAAGRIQIKTNKVLPSYGKPIILMIDPCRRRQRENNVAKQKTDTTTANSDLIISFH